MPRPDRKPHPLAAPRRRSGAGWGRSLPLLGTSFAAGALVFGGHWLLDEPVRNLHLEGRFERVTPVEVQAGLAPGLGGSFLTVDLADLQARVEALEWVRQAQVRRRWPDTVVVQVVEQQVAARWGDAGLINFQGEVFAAESRHAFPELPRLAGPPGTERQVAERYLQLQRRLGAANLTLQTLSVDERGAWRMELQGGQTIRIGRRDVEQRLDRFFRLTAPLLRHRFDRVGHVDMRYANGFSVGWRPGPDDTAMAAARGW